MASQGDADGGYVRLYRRLLENPVFRSDGEAMAFAWLVLKAAWRPVAVRYKGHQIALERGQLAVSVRDMATSLDRSKDWAKRFLDRCADRDMLATEHATGVNIITIRNYSKYQADAVRPATGADTDPRQPRDSGATQNKEGKEVKEGIDVGGDAPARVDRFFISNLAERLCRLGGISQIQPDQISRNVETLRGWLSAGYDIEALIVPTIVEVADSFRPTPGGRQGIGSLSYFSEALATKSRPQREQSNGTTRHANGRTNANAGDAIFAARRELGIDRELGDLGQQAGFGGGSEGPAGILIEAHGRRGCRDDEAA